MTEHPRSDERHEPGGGDRITVQLPREEVEALLLAVDALQPLLDRLRAQIAPVPVESESPATGRRPTSRADDALRRVTRLARQSLHEARLIVGERKVTPEQRTAWQGAARRYWVTARHSVRHQGRRAPTR